MAPNRQGAGQPAPPRRRTSPIVRVNVLFAPSGKSEPVSINPCHLTFLQDQCARQEAALHLQEEQVRAARRVHNRGGMSAMWTNRCHLGIWLAVSTRIPPVSALSTVQCNLLLPSWRSMHARWRVYKRSW